MRYLKTEIKSIGACNIKNGKDKHHTLNKGIAI